MAAQPQQKRPQPLSMREFRENRESAAQLLRYIRDQNPYLKVVYDAAIRIGIMFSHESDSFDDFLQKARTITYDEWRRIGRQFEAANDKLEEFILIGEELRGEIKAQDSSGSNYDKIESYFRTDFHKAQRYKERFDRVFNYFTKYGQYLEQYIGVHEVEGLVREAQSTATEAKNLVDAQKKQLEQSGALSRANVYYELAYGQEPDRAERGKDKWMAYSWKRFQAWSKPRRGYRQVARWWLLSIVLSIVATSAYAYYLYHNLGINFQKSAFEVSVLVFIKLLIIFPLVYLIKFCVHSYRVNKHLEVTYAQRWALHQTLESYLELISEDNNGTINTVRLEQLKKITPFFFHDIETGYITKHDGIGDKSIEIIPEGLFQLLKKD